MRISICSVCHSVYLCVCLSVCVRVYQSVCLCVRLFVSLSIHLSVDRLNMMKTGCIEAKCFMCFYCTPPPFHPISHYPTVLCVMLLRYLMIHCHALCVGESRSGGHQVRFTQLSPKKNPLWTGQWFHFLK